MNSNENQYRIFTASTLERMLIYTAVTTNQIPRIRRIIEYVPDSNRHKHYDVMAELQDGSRAIIEIKTRRHSDNYYFTDFLENDKIEFLQADYLRFRDPDLLVFYLNFFCNGIARLYDITHYILTGATNSTSKLAPVSTEVKERGKDYKDFVELWPGDAQGRYRLSNCCKSTNWVGLLEYYKQNKARRKGDEE